MSYGHAHHLAGTGTTPSTPSTPAAEQPLKADQPATLAPDWYSAPELAAVLGGHDIAALYRWLKSAGVSQRRIAALTGSTQPQVADIVTGRRGQVQTYAVLVRIVEGLGIPRERMGLSFWGPDRRWYGPPGTYPEGVTVTGTPEGVSSAMLRRHLIAQGGIIMVGALGGMPGVPVAEVGEPLDDLGGLPPVALPSRLTSAHVTQVQDLTQRLEDAARAFGSDQATSSDMAARGEQWLRVPGSEPLQQAMLAAVAYRHIHAGMAAYDGVLYQRALYHLARAFDLATQANDPYLQTLALRWAGLATMETGHPDDGLKILQAGQVSSWAIPDRDQRAELEACTVMDSATALAMLGQHQQAHQHVAIARGLWTPSPSSRYGDMDRGPARLELQRGRLDLAEQFAAASVRRWDGLSERGRTRSGIILATIHVKAGEQRGLQLARDALTSASRLTSVRNRRTLLPLAEALDTRPGTDARDLARMARQIAA